MHGRVVESCDSLAWSKLEIDLETWDQKQKLGIVELNAAAIDIQAVAADKIINWRIEPEIIGINQWKSSESGKLEESTRIRKVEIKDTKWTE